jgi:hypothetical protein
MRMRNYDRQQRFVPLPEPIHLGKIFDGVGGIQGKSDVQRNSLSLRINLDTSAADFLCPAMNADLHG